MKQTLFYKPSYLRLKEAIDRVVAGRLEIILYDEDGGFWRDGKALPADAICPAYYWIHFELLSSPRFKDYFQLILASPEARWLHTINSGLDFPGYRDVLEKGVQISNNHSQAIAIAEYSLGQVLSYYQGFEEFREKQVQGIWKSRPFREIYGSRWLLIGFGHIAKAIAVRAKAFGVHIAALRRSGDGEGLADEIVGREELGAALAKADVVVLACASNDSTRGMVDKRFLAAMGEDSLLVNIARGDLVVEEDLHASLDRGRPACAILDVFNHEPPAQDSWVWQHPRVRLTPHCSNTGSGMIKRSDELFLRNLNKVLEDQALENRVSMADIV